MTTAGRLAGFWWMEITNKTLTSNVKASGSIAQGERRQRATSYLRAILYRYRRGIVVQSVFWAIFDRLEKFDG